MDFATATLPMYPAYLEYHKISDRAVATSGFVEVPVEIRQGYAWQRHYKVAILTTDRTQLPALITAAQSAIDARIAEIRSMNNGTPEERQAITEALITSPGIAIEFPPMGDCPHEQPGSNPSVF